MLSTDRGNGADGVAAKKDSGSGNSGFGEAWMERGRASSHTAYGTGTIGGAKGGSANAGSGAGDAALAATAQATLPPSDDNGFDEPALERAVPDSPKEMEVEEPANDPAVAKALRTCACLEPEPHFVANVSLISVGAMLGVLAREALVLTAPYSPISTFMSNLVGTGVLAYTSSAMQQGLSFAYSPICVGICTGFCGSLTTFSTWQVAAALVVSPVPSGLSPAQLAYQWFEVEFFGMAVNLMGWDVGIHLWEAVPLRCRAAPLPSAPAPALRDPTKAGASDVVGAAVSAAVFALAAAAVVSLTALLYTPLLFALCWGPFGALLRWRLGKLNSLVSSFPLGTFAANFVGCGLAALVHVLELSIPGSSVPCRVLSGFSFGFCGALTTVSTFVFELKHLTRTQAYLYGLSTVVLSQALALLIIGTFAAARRGDSFTGSCLTSST
jgi:CrcB protein